MHQTPNCHNAGEDNKGAAPNTEAFFSVFNCVAEAFVCTRSAPAREGSAREQDKETMPGVNSSKAMPQDLYSLVEHREMKRVRGGRTNGRRHIKKPND